MLRLSGVWLCFFALVIAGSPVYARQSQTHRKVQASPSAPPFPWHALLETVGPIVGICFGAVLLKRTMRQEKTKASPDTGEVASLPVAWFAAMSRLFEKKALQPKAEPPGRLLGHPDSLTLDT
jgi:hypothetical protein